MYPIGAGAPNTGCASALWRFFELFKRLGIRPTLALNARVCDDYPRVAEQPVDYGSFL